MAQTSILGRMGQLVRANINALLDSAEDPEKMLNQMVLAYPNNIREAEEAVAQTIGNLRLLEDDAKEAKEASSEWGAQALAASRTADEFRTAGNAADADDLLQEAFCRLLAMPLDTRDEGRLRAYLFRAASNAATDLWRRGGRGTRRAEPLTDTAAVTGDHAADAALKRDMARTFRGLKPRERMLLWLAHVEGSAHAEIADALGLSAASVPVLLFRARRKLAGLLRQKGYGPGER